ncbi:MAG: cytochrome-c peroxidase [Crocinitomicaceae bacterium]|nr:cytochrome-c peroxidase [Crocinitomicaceae bacterium]
MNAGLKYSLLILPAITVMVSCRYDIEELPEPPPTGQSHKTTPYELVIPPFFPPMDIPADNPLTVEGVELGRFLFWEKKLSGDNTMSCGTCHLPEHAFSDPQQFSVGIHGDIGNRQAMALINLGWSTSFFWDGRAMTLEDQVVQPVINPIEMDDSWEDVLQELRNDPLYPPKFKAAFGTTEITQQKAAKAMASFVRTMISAGSKFDKQRIGQYTFTPEEEHGFNLFILEGGSPDQVPGGSFGADCFHCHGFGAMQMTDYLFHNNGLDASFENDPGRFNVTGNPLDSGRFKAPTLRNVEYSAPYMHDGRFATLEQVVEHYNSGGIPSSTIDPFMKFTSGGLQLSAQSKQDLIAFLKCLTDNNFFNNPDFSDPHE